MFKLFIWIHCGVGWIDVFHQSNLFEIRYSVKKPTKKGWRVLFEWTANREDVKNSFEETVHLLRENPMFLNFSGTCSRYCQNQQRTKLQLHLCCSTHWTVHNISLDTRTNRQEPWGPVSDQTSARADTVPTPEGFDYGFTQSWEPLDDCGPRGVLETTKLDLQTLDDRIIKRGVMWDDSI